MRLDMLDPPYDQADAERLARLLPPGVEPAHLLRQLLRHHPDLTEALMILPGFLHGPGSRLDPRTRELIVARTLARWGNEYEWGIHLAPDADVANFSTEQRVALATGAADDPVWDRRDQVLLLAVDELHDTDTLSAESFTALLDHLDGGQALELAVVAGWYRATSLLSNTLQPPLEDGPRLPAG
jgi:4-carboxymuconolactone decarboxylase